MERYFQANRIIFIITFIIIIIIIIITIISRPHCCSRRISLLPPVLYHTPNLSCQWWVDLSDHMGNEFTDHQLCVTDFAVSIPRLGMCFFIYQLYL